MIPTQCPTGQDPRMCAYCDQKDTCGCTCDDTTDAIWGKISGDLADQTDLVAELDNREVEIKNEITSDISTLQSSINAVQSTADDAHRIGESANAIANDARDMASSAQSAAEAAQSTADTLQTSITDLQTTVAEHTTSISSIEGNVSSNTLAIDEVREYTPMLFRMPISNGEDKLPRFPVVYSGTLANLFINYYKAMEIGTASEIRNAAQQLSKLSGGYINFYAKGSPLFYTDDSQSLQHEQYFKPCLMRFYDRILNLTEPFISVPTFEIVLTDDITAYLEKLYGLSGAAIVAMTIDGAKGEYWSILSSDEKTLLLKIPF